MWLEAVTNINEYSDNAWATPLYGRALTKNSIGRHRHILSPDIRRIIAEVCGDVARQLGVASEISRREDEPTPDTEPLTGVAPAISS
jgi:hypothetical protein